MLDSDQLKLYSVGSMFVTYAFKTVASLAGASILHNINQEGWVGLGSWGEGAQEGGLGGRREGGGGGFWARAPAILKYLPEQGQVCLIGTGLRGDRGGGGGEGHPGESEAWEEGVRGRGRGCMGLI